MEKTFLLFVNSRSQQWLARNITKLTGGPQWHKSNAKNPTALRLLAAAISRAQHSSQPAEQSETISGHFLQKLR
jgi:hypothetical protein